MIEKKGNKNSLRSKKLIKNAFIGLFVEKEISKITVTDIINSAEISRATFYAHYSDIAHLLDSIETDAADYIEAHLMSFGIEKALKSPDAYFNSLLGYLSADIELYRKIAISDNSRFFYDRLSAVIKARMLSSIEAVKGEFSEPGKVKFLFFFNAVFSLMFEWLCGDIDMPYTILAGTISTLLSKNNSIPFSLTDSLLV